MKLTVKGIDENDLAKRIMYIAWQACVVLQEWDGFKIEDQMLAKLT